MKIGQHASCGPQIWGHPASNGRVKGNTAIRCFIQGDTRILAKQRIFRYFGKLMELSVEKISVHFLLEQEMQNHELIAGEENFAGLSYLFIYSIFLLLGGRSGPSGKQIDMDNNLFSRWTIICLPEVTVV